MLPVADALAQIRAHAAPLDAVNVPAAEALGRALAEDIASDIDSPPWDKALVDGYAVLADDVAGDGSTLAILEEVTAGKVPTRNVVRGHCTRIMTGAPLPAGADAVVMIETTELLDQQNVKCNAAAKPGQNILRRAASMKQGEIVLRAGRVIRPIEIGVLAEAGRTQVQVHRASRVAILATGDELVDAARYPAAGQIRNSNGPMLAALVAAAGAEAVPLGIARDDEADLPAKIEAGLHCDVLVLAGGVSAGVLDLVPQMLAKLGVREVFHKVNLKPGKPLWFGVRERTLVFGLPGNPVSTLVCFGLFVKPAIAQLAGLHGAVTSRRAILAEDFQQRDARPTYYPAVLTRDGAQDAVAPLVWRGSADLRALADANCLAYFPVGPRLFAAGESIEVFDL